MRSSQAGNAIVIILIAVFLFGALAAVFMRGAKTGQGNLTTQQAKLAAQEILDFYNSLERAANKLRSKGCSENDISFANPNDAGAFITYNHPSTAPSDNSCHIFDPAGANLLMGMDWEKYQISRDQIPTVPEDNYGQSYMRIGIAGIIGVGTDAGTDLMFQLNYVNPKICDEYNKLLKYQIDLTVTDNGPFTGDENTALAKKFTSCYARNLATNFYQIRYVWSAR